MKTHLELLIEARRVESLGRQYADEHRRSMADGSASDFFAPRILVTFPESHFTGVDGVRTRERWMEVAMTEGALEYRLWEVEREETASGELVRDIGPVFLMGSDSAFDVLDEAEELTEKERLGEALAPFMARTEKDEFVESIDPTIVEEIENIVAAGDLTPSTRIRTKADIVDFLEGRLDPSEFIAATIERQRWREDVREVLTERVDQRMVIAGP